MQKKSESKIILLLLLCLLGISKADVQKVAVKTNLFYGAYILTSNLGVDVKLRKYNVLKLSGELNPWNRGSLQINNKKLVDRLGQIDYRHYNIRELELLLLFGKGSTYNRFSC